MFPFIRRCGFPYTIAHTTSTLNDVQSLATTNETSQ